MRVIFRFLALIFLVVALMLLGADVVASLQKGTFISSSLSQSLTLVHGDPKVWLDAHTPGYVVPWTDKVLTFWSWAVIGVLGILFSLLGGRRHGA